MAINLVEIHAPDGSWIVMDSDLSDTQLNLLRKPAEDSERLECVFVSFDCLIEAQIHAAAGDLLNLHRAWSKDGEDVSGG